MTLKALFTSNKDDYGTPPQVFDPINKVFNFGLDSAADAENTKVPGNYYTIEDDALTIPWDSETGTVWLNPPYGRGKMTKWLQKAKHEADTNGLTVACLIPARTSEGWWLDVVVGKVDTLVYLTGGRVKFIGGEHTATFPSVLAIYRPLQARNRSFWWEWRRKEFPHDA